MHRKAMVSVENSDAFHLLLGIFLLFFLFTWIMLPPPLNKIGKMVSDLGYYGFELSKKLGFVTDDNICVLADMYNIGGIKATVRYFGCSHKEGEIENISCAFLDEKKIAVTPADLEKYEEACGELIDVWIIDKRAANKLYYLPYTLMGFVIAALVADIYVLTVGRKKETGKVLGYGTMIVLGLTLTLMRTGAVWPMLTVMNQLIPIHGNLLATLISLLFIYVSLSWALGEIAFGFYMAKEAAVKFKAIETAVRADYERGRMGLEAVRNRR